MQRKAVFRHGSTVNLEDNFTPGQTWVNSKPKSWKPTACPSVSSQSTGTGNIIWEHGEIDASPTPSECTTGHGKTASNMVEPPSAQKESNTDRTNPDITVSVDPHHQRQQSVQKFPIHMLSSPQSSLTSNANLHFYLDSYCSQTGKRRRTSDDNTLFSSSRNDIHITTFGTVQESCLIRYFIEEISPWVRRDVF